MIDRAELDKRFTAQRLSAEQERRYQRTQELGREFAEHIGAAVPSSREQSLALTKLEEAVFWANAGIGRRMRG